MIPTKIPARLGLLALLLAVPACKDKGPGMAKFAEVMPNLPLPPQASVISRSGSSDALQITVKSPAKAKDVEAYYRTTLSSNGWRLVNEMRDRDGSVVLLAEQDGPPLWVRIKSTDDSVGTLVDLAGAMVTDSTSRLKPAS